MAGTVRSAGNIAINKIHKFLLLLELMYKLGVGEGKKLTNN